MKERKKKNLEVRKKREIKRGRKKGREGDREEGRKMKEVFFFCSEHSCHFLPHFTDFI